MGSLTVVNLTVVNLTVVNLTVVICSTRLKYTPQALAHLGLPWHPREDLNL